MSALSSLRLMLAPSASLRSPLSFLFLLLGLTFALACLLGMERDTQLQEPPQACALVAGHRQELSNVTC